MARHCQFWAAARRSLAGAAVVLTSACTGTSATPGPAPSSAESGAPSGALRVVATWQVAHHGRDPIAAAVSDDRAFIAIAPAPNATTSTIVEVSLDSGVKLGEWPIDGYPVALAASDDWVWVAVGRGDATASGIDTDEVIRFSLDGTRVAAFPVTHPIDVVAVAGSVVVESAPNAGHTTIGRIDASGIRQVVTLDRDALGEPGGLAVCGDTIYVAVDSAGGAPTFVEIIHDGQVLLAPVTLPGRGVVSLACTPGGALAAQSPSPASLSHLTTQGVLATNGLPTGISSIQVVAGGPAIFTTGAAAIGTLSLVDPVSLALIGEPLAVGSLTPASDGTVAITTTEADLSGEPGSDGLFHTTITVAGS